MKIVSWNINGLISWIESQSYLPIKGMDPDVVCLQEIKTKRKLTVFSDYYHYWYPCERDGFHGTMTISKDKPLNVIYGTGDERIDAEGRVLTVECPTLFVVNCYAPRAESLERHEFRRLWDNSLQEFVKRLLDKGKQVVLCGDFNALRSKLDVYPENEREHYAMQGILSDERSNIESLLEIGFIDAYRHFFPHTVSYTWWSSRKNKRIEDKGWRLDYFFVSSNAAPSVKQVLHLTDVMGSDHAPILLELDTLFTNQNYAEEWKQTDWIEAEKVLENYQQELTRATFAKNWKRVSLIQSNMVNDSLIKRLAVRHVAMSANTPGIDNERWRTAADKMKAAKRLNQKPYSASPLRQIILVDKSSGKERSIGIPTMYDRAMHKLYGYAIAPIMEATSEERSYGFRLGRSAFDLHEEIKSMLLAPNAPEYIVRGDIKAFYASVQHRWIEEHISMDKDILKEFMHAGHVFAGELFPSNGIGMSEGSSLSPILSNLILNGLQKHIYIALGVWRKKGEMDYQNGRMVRYVDDVIFSVRTERDGKKVIDALNSFLSERGLTISKEKTYVVPVEKGFTFLSRSYRMESGMLYTSPSDEATGRFIGELDRTVMKSENKSQRELIRLLNRKLKGWATYHRITDAKEAFHKIDIALQGLLLKNAFARHPKMAHSKVIHKYWYKDSTGRNVYALPGDKSVRLQFLSDIPLIQYKPIIKKMNPYADAGYFESRNHAKAIEHITAEYRPIWERQGGKCKYCGRPILPDQKRTLVPINLQKPMTLDNAAYVHELCKDNEVEYIGHMGNPFDLRVMDTLHLLEEVARIKENRKHYKISYLKEKWMPGDTRWSHILLKRYFSICMQPVITLTFKKIEEIEGRKLHPASKKESFWSEKKKSYKTIADTWKSEGYELKKLDLENEKITVSRIKPQSLLRVPDELTKQILPEDAVYELETHFQYIIKKYGLHLN